MKCKVTIFVYGRPRYGLYEMVLMCYRQQRAIPKTLLLFGNLDENDDVREGDVFTMRSQKSLVTGTLFHPAS